MSTNLFKYIQGVLGDHMCVLTRAPRLYLTILNAVLNVVFIFKNTIPENTVAFPGCNDLPVPRGIQAVSK